MGATLVNMSSGAMTRLSGVIEGVLAFVAFLVLGTLISWVPVAGLAAILIVVGVRMIDRHSFQFLKQRSTILDFAVIATVVATALTVSLIAASGAGIALAAALFIREQIGGAVVRRKISCSETFSKRVRTHEEMEIFVAHGKRGVVVELQGSLFFGTANQLYSALEWVEDAILKDEICELDEQGALGINDIELFKGRKAATLAALEQCMEKRSCKAGDKIFSRGDAGDELFLIRRGAVRIMLPISERLSHHLGTFGRGAFFGEMAFLDGDVRSADAVAFSDTELYVLSRKAFDAMAEEHKKLALAFMEGLASTLACRLRYTNAELRVLET